MRMMTLSNALTKQDVVVKRRELQYNSRKGLEFKKGDKRVYTPRVCVICGRPLSSLILNTGRYVSAHPHTRFHINESLSVDICTDIESCYRNLNRDGRLVDYVDGR